MKKSACILITAAMTLAMSLTAMAAGWQNDSNGWWWLNDDGSWPNRTWQWLDGNRDGVAERYYFDQTGYMLADTVTPDGSLVNADGKWTIDGQIQTRHVYSPAELETLGYTDKISNAIWDLMSHTGAENAQLFGIPDQSVSFYIYPAYPYLRVMYGTPDGEIDSDRPYLIVIRSAEIELNRIFTDAPAAGIGLEDIANHLQSLGYEVTGGHAISDSSQLVRYIKAGKFDIAFDGYGEMRIRQERTQEAIDKWIPIFSGEIPLPERPDL